jgi:hypothetical protein
MTKCPFKVGDTVRRLIGTSTDTYPGFQGEVTRIRPVSHGGYDLHFSTGECGTYWSEQPNGWELVSIVEVSANPVPTAQNLFISHGYNVKPASNGGFILYRDERDPGRVTDTAAFSNAADMLLWLTEAHGVPA